MSNIQYSFEKISQLPASFDAPHVNSLRLFSFRMKAVWALITLLTCAAGLISVGPMPVPLFYVYYGIKVALFFAVGFVSPLAFYRLNRIGLGLTLSLLSAFTIELVQGLAANGHSFHWYELVGKLVLIALGFALALDRRYERKISVGPIEIGLQMNDPLLFP